MAKFVREQVKAGRYASPDDAINAAVSRLQTDRAFAGDEVEEIRKDIDLGLAEADRKDFVEFTAEQVIAARQSARTSPKRGA